MTVLDAVKKLQELLYKDDDIISQDNLFEAQQLADSLVRHFEKTLKK